MESILRIRNSSADRFQDRELNNLRAPLEFNRRTIIDVSALMRMRLDEKNPTKSNRMSDRGEFIQKRPELRNPFNPKVVISSTILNCPLKPDTSLILRRDYRLN
jgi:hypothetical protein